MAVSKILIYPDAFLRKPTKKFPTSDLELQTLLLPNILDDLEDTLEEVDKGAALAANQIGHPYKIFVTNQQLTMRSGMEATKRPCDQVVMSIPPFIINPEIVEKSRNFVPMNEGCLSFPGIELKVQRYEWVTVKYQTVFTENTLELNEITETYRGFWGQVFQHEIDHLEGKLFVDNLSSKKRLEIVKFLQRKK